MQILDFKGKALAEAWQKDVQDLNDRTDQILGRVYACIEEIKTESEGDFVERLIQAAADMADAAAEMIKAIKSIEDLISDLIHELANLVGNAVQSVADHYTQITDV